MTATAISTRTSYSTVILNAAAALTTWKQTDRLPAQGAAHLHELVALLHDGLPTHEADPGDIDLQAILIGIWMAQSEGKNTFVSWCRQIRESADAIYGLGADQQPENRTMEMLHRLIGQRVHVIEPTRPRDRSTVEPPLYRD